METLAGIPLAIQDYEDLPGHDYIIKLAPLPEDVATARRTAISTIIAYHDAQTTRQEGSDGEETPFSFTSIPAPPGSAIDWESDETFRTCFAHERPLVSSRTKQVTAAPQACDLFCEITQQGLRTPFLLGRPLNSTENRRFVVLTPIPSEMESGDPAPLRIITNPLYFRNRTITPLHIWNFCPFRAREDMAKDPHIDLYLKWFGLFEDIHEATHLAQALAPTRVNTIVQAPLEVHADLVPRVLFQQTRKTKKFLGPLLNMRYLQLLFVKESHFAAPSLEALEKNQPLPVPQDLRIAMILMKQALTLSSQGWDLPSIHHFFNVRSETRVFVRGQGTTIKNLMRENDQNYRNNFAPHHFPSLQANVTYLKNLVDSGLFSAMPFPQIAFLSDRIVKAAEALNPALTQGEIHLLPRAQQPVFFNNGPKRAPTIRRKYARPSAIMSQQG